MRSACLLPFGGLLLSATLSSQQPYTTLLGDPGIARAGTALASGSADVDRDGFPDVLTGGVDTNGCGVQLWSGHTGAALASFRAPVATRLGAALAFVGDLDGDGYPEYLIGAPGATRSGVAAGAVFVMSGRDHTLLREFDGTVLGGSVGASALGLPDIDGDGRDELAVGALADGNGLGQGRTLLLATRRTGLSGAPFTVPLASGGVQRLAVDFGVAAAGQTYLVLGSASGTKPGFAVVGHLGRQRSQCRHARWRGHPR